VLDLLDLLCGVFLGLVHHLLFEALAGIDGGHAGDFFETLLGFVDQLLRLPRRRLGRLLASGQRTFFFLQRFFLLRDQRRFLLDVDFALRQRLLVLGQLVAVGFRFFLGVLLGAEDGFFRFDQRVALDVIGFGSRSFEKRLCLAGGVFLQLAAAARG